MTRSEKDKMLAGELYRADAPELVEDRVATAAWLTRYNAAAPGSAQELSAILKERLAEIGDGAVVRQPFYCDYGYNIRIGAGVFLNFNCVILDVVSVVIGEGTQIGPAVQIYAADHPRDPRRAGPGWNLGARFASAAMSGSAAARSCYPASPSATTPSSAPAASSPTTCRRASPSSAIPPASPGCAGRWGEPLQNSPLR